MKEVFFGFFFGILFLGIAVVSYLSTPKKVFDDDAFAYCVSIPPPGTEWRLWGDIIKACTEYAKEPRSARYLPQR